MKKPLRAKELIFIYEEDNKELNRIEIILGDRAFLAHSFKKDLISLDGLIRTAGSKLLEHGFKKIYYEGQDPHLKLLGFKEDLDGWSLDLEDLFRSSCDDKI